MSSGISGLESAEKKKPVQTSLPTPVVKEPQPKPVSSLDCLDLSSDSDSEIIPPAPKPIIAPVQMTTPKVKIVFIVFIKMKSIIFRALDKMC